MPVGVVFKGGKQSHIIGCYLKVKRDSEHLTDVIFSRSRHTGGANVGCSLTRQFIKVVNLGFWRLFVPVLALHRQGDSCHRGRNARNMVRIEVQLYRTPLAKNNISR